MEIAKFSPQNDFFGPIFFCNLRVSHGIDWLLLFHIHFEGLKMDVI